jgi:streptogramin lyase
MALRFGRMARPLISILSLGAFVAGCSASHATAVPAAGSGANGVRANVAAARGQARRVAAAAHRPGWTSGDAKAGFGLIYTGSYDSNEITILKNKGKVPPVVGTITNGINEPERLFVDRRLRLWVSNLGNDTVTAYPPGVTSPSITLSAGINYPTGLVVGGDGTVYVANTGNDTVTVYRRGKTKLQRTIALTNETPENLAVDASNNLYISYLGGNRGSGVIKVPPGQTQGTDLNLNVGDAEAIEVDRAGNIILLDGSVPGVDIFPAGKTNPSKTIPITDGNAFELSLNKAETELYVSVEVGLPFYIEVTAYPGGTHFRTRATQNVQEWPLAVSPDNAL